MLRRSPLAVAVVVLTAAALWVTYTHQIGRGWHDFALVGEEFLERSSTSDAIDANRRHAQPGPGYDGQFFLFVAQDPAGARPYLDDPAYRYSRIGYPLLARALALGQDDLIAPMLVVVNVIAIAAGTLALASLLRRRGVSPWLALLFAAYPGLFVALLRDLSEALAYSLVACAAWLYDRGRLFPSAAVFAAAALTREGALVFALAWAALLVLEGRRRAGVLFALGASAPYLAWRLFLHFSLGDAGLPDRVRPTLVPFGGIAEYWPAQHDGVQQTYSVVVPALLALGVGIWAWRRGARDAALLALAANVVLFVVVLPAESYREYLASGRIATGVVLAFLLALPALLRVLPSTRTWLWLPVVLWFAPWFSLLPHALASG